VEQKTPLIDFKGFHHLLFHRGYRKQQSVMSVIHPNAGDDEPEAYQSPRYNVTRSEDDELEEGEPATEDSDLPYCDDEDEAEDGAESGPEYEDALEDEGESEDEDDGELDGQFYRSLSSRAQTLLGGPR
jgi:hypothetical protein